jgi:hypothetical protein
MKRSTWKAVERGFAEALGGRRVPVTGRSRGDAPDVEHEKWSIEVKAGRVMSQRLLMGMAQAEEAAKGTDKVPLLCISQSHGPGHPTDRLVMLRLADFQQLIGVGVGDTDS